MNVQYIVIILINIIMSKLGIAINIASEVFKNKTDKGGHPYML